MNRALLSFCLTIIMYAYARGQKKLFSKLQLQTREKKSVCVNLIHSAYFLSRKKAKMDFLLPVKNNKKHDKTNSLSFYRETVVIKIKCKSNKTLLKGIS